MLVAAGEYGCVEQRGIDVPPGPIADVTRIRTRDDVVAIRTFWSPVPWLTDSDGRAVGFRVPVYFVSGQTELGAFVPGEIEIKLYAVERRSDGRSERQLVHEWKFDEAAATPFRVRKRAVAGYFYGFMLTWPEELDLSGRTIEIAFSYHSRSGRAVEGPAKQLPVPGRPGQRRLPAAQGA